MNNVTQSFSPRKILAVLAALLLVGMLAASGFSQKLSAPAQGLVAAPQVEGLLAGGPSEDPTPVPVPAPGGGQQMGWTAWSG